MKPYRQALKNAGGRTYDGLKVPPHELYVIGVDTDHDRSHPLWKPDSVALAHTSAYDPQWIAGMRVHGVVQPVTVQVVRPAEDDSLWPEAARGQHVYAVVAGRKRVLHARAAVEEMLAEGLLPERRAWTVKATVEARTDSATTVAVAAIENLHRRAPSPLELGVSFIQRVASGVDPELAARELGYSLRQAQRYAVLAEQGIPALHAALQAGRIKASDACRIAAMPVAGQTAAVDALLAGEGAATGHEVTAAIAEAEGKPTPLKPPTRTAAVRAYNRAVDSDFSTRECQLIAVLCGQMRLEDATEEIRGLFA